MISVLFNMTSFDISKGCPWFMEGENKSLST